MANRGIDHLVLCVRDLGDARATYERMGFTLTPRALHPFGTANSLVQLQGSFLELLAVAEPEKIVETTAESFGFAAFNRDYLAKGEGMSMLVFESENAQADRAEFAASGLSRWAPFDFERLARLPDGSDVTVGFSLTFVTRPDMTRAAFFTCQQHAPQYFWKPEYQVHSNTARTVAEVVMVAPDPAECRPLYEGLQGPQAVEDTAEGLAVATARGRIAVIGPDAWTARYPDFELPDLSEGPRFAGYTIGVADLHACAECLGAAGFSVTRTGASLAVPAGEAHGVVIEFAPAAG